MKASASFKGQSVIKKSSTIQSLYRNQFFLLMTLILVYTVLTTAHFIGELLAVFTTGALALTLLSTESRNCLKEFQIWLFLGLFYAFMPFYASLTIYVVGSFSLVIFYYLLTKFFEDTLSHPVLFIVCLLYGTLFSQYHSHLQYVHLFGSSLSLYEWNLTSVLTLKEFFYGLTGCYFSSPSQVGGALILLLYFFLKKERRIFLFQGLAFIAGVFLVSYLWFFLFTGSFSSASLAYLKLLKEDLLQSPLFFIALFVLSENMVAPFSLRGRRIMVLTSVLLTSLFYVLGIGFMSSFLALFLVFLYRSVLEVLLRKKLV